MIDPRPSWIMAGGHDISEGLLDRCAMTAASLRRGEYQVVRIHVERQLGMDRWLIPKKEFQRKMPEIRIVDDPVRMDETDHAVVMEIVAHALSGAQMSDDEGERAIAALRAMVVSDGMFERCRPARRKTLRAALPAPWGPACARDMVWSGTTDVFGEQMTFGDAARNLPTCTSVRYATEPDHVDHLRVESASVLCTQDNGPDAVATLRTLADLEERPFA